MVCYLRCLVAISPLLILQCSFAFEGRIRATLTRGGEAEHFLYSASTNRLRIERIDANWPHALDILNLQSGELTLVFPHNRSFVRLQKGGEARTGGQGSRADASAPPGVSVPALPRPGTPQMPPGIGLQPGSIGAPAGVPGPGMPQIPPGIGPQPGASGAALNGAGGKPAVPLPIPPTPMRPQMPGLSPDHLELVQTNGATNILGFECTYYELKQRGQVMEIWATEELFPFRLYQPNQLHHRGPPVLEEQWEELLRAKKLFPLLAILKVENGPERMHFEVKAVTPETFQREDALFEPPPDYREMQPLPF